MNINTDVHYSSRTKYNHYHSAMHCFRCKKVKNVLVRSTDGRERCYQCDRIFERRVKKLKTYFKTLIEAEREQHKQAMERFYASNNHQTTYHYIKKICLTDTEIRVHYHTNEINKARKVQDLTEVSRFHDFIDISSNLPGEMVIKLKKDYQDHSQPQLVYEAICDYFVAQIYFDSPGSEAEKRAAVNQVFKQFNLSPVLFVKDYLSYKPSATYREVYAAYSAEQPHDITKTVFSQFYESIRSKEVST